MHLMSFPTPMAKPNANRIRPPGRASWTPQADTRLVQLHLAGLSLRGMATAFRLSRSAIGCRARDLGLTLPKKPSPAPAKPQVAGDCSADPNREPLPAGHAISWDLITAGTCLEGTPYERPQLGRCRTVSRLSAATEHDPSSSAYVEL